MSVILICSIGAITHGGQANSLEIETTNFISSANQRYVSTVGNGDGISEGDIGAYEVDPINQVLFTYLPIVGKPCPFLYYDNFSDPNSGWPTFDSASSLAEYSNGEYRLLMRSSDGFVAVRSGFKAVDYRVSVDLRNVTGVEGSYGILFVAKPDWSGWYSLEIFPDGWFGIYRYYPNDNQYIWVELEADYSPAIHQGMQSNNISVERNGSAITAYANGQFLITINDSNLTGEGYLGLINFTFGQGDVDIRYDNFTVIPAGCGDKNTLSNYSISGQFGWLEQSNLIDNLQTSFTKHLP
jgi:hypothetical protein